MKQYLLLLSIVLLGVVYTDCSKAQGVNKLSAEEFQQKLASTADAQLVDVRTPQEFQGGHIANAMNININGSDFETKIAMLDKNKPVMVYCLAGGRSSSAASYMSKQGFKTIYELQGGVNKWNAAGKPLEGANPNAKGMSMEEFRAKLSGDKPVLVDVSAKWCAPCRVMAPMLDSLAKEMSATMVFVNIDADANKDLLKQLKVEELPTFFLYRQGNVVWTKTGLSSKQELIAKIQEK